jgi:hypothetical protein
MHRWSIAVSIISLVGGALPPSNWVAHRICPGWQKPHCGTCSSIQASCSGCVPSGESPSMVVTTAPSTSAAISWQLSPSLPFTRTVQAPQAPIPQPYFVPRRPMISLISHSSGVDGSALTVWKVPLMFSSGTAVATSGKIGHGKGFPECLSEVAELWWGVKGKKEGLLF